MIRLIVSMTIDAVRQRMKAKPERLPRSVRNAYQPDQALENAVNQAIWEEWNSHGGEQIPLF